MCVVPGRLRDLAFHVNETGIAVRSAITTPFTELRSGVYLIVKARSASTALIPQTRQSGISRLLIFFDQLSQKPRRLYLCVGSKSANTKLVFGLGVHTTVGRCNWVMQKTGLPKLMLRDRSQRKVPNYLHCISWLSSLACAHAQLILWRQRRP